MAKKLVTIVISDGIVEKELFRVKKGNDGSIYIHPAASKTKQGAHISIHASGEIHVRYDGVKPASILKNVGELVDFQGCEVVHGYYIDRPLFGCLARKYVPESGVSCISVDLSSLPQGWTFLVIHLAIVTRSGLNRFRSAANTHRNHSRVILYRRSRPWIGFFYYWD
jgi:hypothetical protein